MKIFIHDCILITRSGKHLHPDRGSAENRGPNETRANQVNYHEVKPLYFEVFFVRVVVVVVIITVVFLIFIAGFMYDVANDNLSAQTKRGALRLGMVTSRDHG